MVSQAVIIFVVLNSFVQLIDGGMSAILSYIFGASFVLKKAIIKFSEIFVF